MLDENTLRKAAERLAKAASQPAVVILFGSYARGDADAASDLDLLVVEETLTDKASEYLRLRQALGSLPSGVDILLMSRNEFERRRQVKGTVPYHASNEGRVLYDAAA
ncbi:MAG: nucleotidyltransferase domain-containing protein [Rhodocyclaceae bacterium]|jgi:predicted nucleotidyltransferase|nr:nucleotidyltransferase domain-containing protein [Rhodocyclaceae bacterium]